MEEKKKEMLTQATYKKHPGIIHAKGKQQDDHGSSAD